MSQSHYIIKSSKGRSNSRCALGAVAMVAAVALAFPGAAMAYHGNGEDASGIQSITDIEEMAKSVPGRLTEAVPPAPHVFAQGEDASGFQSLTDIEEMAKSAGSDSVNVAASVPHVFAQGEDASGFQSILDIEAHARWADGVEKRTLADAASDQQI